MTKKVVLGLSGGMDSTVLLYKACTEFDEVYCLFFNYGQRHIKEKQYADYQVSNCNSKFGNKVTLSVIDLPLRQLVPTSSLTNDDIDTPDIRKVAGEAQPVSYVPFRNMMFLSFMLAKAEAVKANTVWYGATLVDSLAGYWDTDENFINLINSVADLNREHRINVIAPLVTMDKKDIILEGIKLGVDFKNTYTCYSGEELPDAYSPSSSLRIKGFVNAGYIDPLQYKQDLTNTWSKYNCKPI